jgi:hypothetical protein
MPPLTELLADVVQAVDQCKSPALFAASRSFP